MINKVIRTSFGNRHHHPPSHATFLASGLRSLQGRLLIAVAVSMSPAGLNCWWSGPPSFISSGPPSPYTATLLDSPTPAHHITTTAPHHVTSGSYHPLQQHFFSAASSNTVASIQERLSYHCSGLPPFGAGPATASSSMTSSLTSTTIPEGRPVCNCYSSVSGGSYPSSGHKMAVPEAQRCYLHSENRSPASEGSAEVSATSCYEGRSSSSVSSTPSLQSPELTPGQGNSSSSRSAQHSRQNSFGGCSAKGHRGSSEDDLSLRARKNSLKSSFGGGTYIRKSSTDEMPYFKLAYTIEQEQRQKADSLQEWMKCARSQVGQEPLDALSSLDLEVKATDPAASPCSTADDQRRGQREPPDTATLSTTSDKRQGGSFENTANDKSAPAPLPDEEACVASYGDNDCTASPLEEEMELPDGEGSESGGSHSHTEMASIIEYPADSATPDVSLSDAQEGCELVESNLNDRSQMLLTPACTET